MEKALTESSYWGGIIMEKGGTESSYMGDNHGEGRD